MYNRTHVSHFHTHARARAHTHTQDLVNSLESLAKVAMAARAAGTSTSATTPDAQLALVEQARKLGAMALVANRGASEIPGAWANS